MEPIYYHVRSSSDGYATLKHDNTAVSWNETSLTANTPYTYHVYSVSASNVENANYVTTATKYTWPNAATAQSAVAASNVQMNVTWTAPAGGANHYHVRSSSDTYGSVKYDNTTAAWNEAGLSANTSYIYRIYTVNADNVENSNYIATAGKYTWPNAPATQAATASSTAQLDVTWTAPVGGANHYHVRSSSDTYGAIKQDGAPTSWSELGLSANTFYIYRIYAVNADNVENTGDGQPLPNIPGLAPQPPRRQWQIPQLR